MNVINVVKLFVVSLIVMYMKNPIIEKTYECSEWVKPLHIKIIFVFIGENMEERSDKNVIIVLKSLYVTVIFKHITELMLERNPMKVTSVLKPLHVTVFFSHERICT